MALANPYPLSFLSKRLVASEVTFDIKRNDEVSGGGDGRYWIAKLARPLWTVRLALSGASAAAAREIDAKIHALAGAGTFLFTEELYAPAGGAPGSSITVGAIGSDRTQITLAGLAAGFVPSAGDRLSITVGAKTYFGVIADGGGATVSIFPDLPFWVATGQPVRMAAPQIKVMVPPGGYTPFTMRPGYFGQGASITMLQKP